jgi:hypothetical protein
MVSNNLKTKINVGGRNQENGEKYWGKKTK